MPVGHPSFVAVQRLFMGGRYKTEDGGLVFRPDDPVTAEDWERWGGRGEPPRSRCGGGVALPGLKPLRRWNGNVSTGWNWAKFP